MTVVKESLQAEGTLLLATITVEDSVSITIEGDAIETVESPKY